MMFECSPVGVAIIEAEITSDRNFSSPCNYCVRIRVILESAFSINNYCLPFLLVLRSNI